MLCLVLLFARYNVCCCVILFVTLVCSLYDSFVFVLILLVWFGFCLVYCLGFGVLLFCGVLIVCCFVVLGTLFAWLLSFAG